MENECWSVDERHVNAILTIIRDYSMLQYHGGILNRCSDDTDYTHGVRF